MLGFLLLAWFLVLWLLYDVVLLQVILQVRQSFGLHVQHLLFVFFILVAQPHAWWVLQGLVVWFQWKLGKLPLLFCCLYLLELLVWKCQVVHIINIFISFWAFLFAQELFECFLLASSWPSGILWIRIFIWRLMDYWKLIFASWVLNWISLFWLLDGCVFWAVVLVGLISNYGLVFGSSLFVQRWRDASVISRFWAFALTILALLNFLFCQLRISSSRSLAHIIYRYSFWLSRDRIDIIIVHIVWLSSWRFWFTAVICKRISSFIHR